MFKQVFKVILQQNNKLLQTEFIQILSQIKRQYLFKYSLNVQQVLEQRLPKRNAHYQLNKLSLHSQNLVFFSTNNQEQYPEIIEQINEKYKLFGLLLETGRSEEGIKVLQEAIRLEEENNCNNSSTKCLELGVVLFQLGRYKEAIDYLQSKKELMTTKNPNKRRLTVQYDYYIVQSQLNLEKLKGDESEFRDCIRFLETNPSPVLLSSLQQQMKSLDQQEKDNENCILFEHSLDIIKKFEKMTDSTKQVLTEVYWRRAVGKLALKNYLEGDIQAYDFSEIWNKIEGEQKENLLMYFNMLFAQIIIRIKRGKFQEAGLQLKSLQIKFISLLVHDKKQYIYLLFQAQLLHHFVLTQRNKIGEVNSEDVTTFLSTIKLDSFSFENE